LRPRFDYFFGEREAAGSTFKLGLGCRRIFLVLLLAAALLDFFLVRGSYSSSSSYEFYSFLTVYPPSSIWLYCCCFLLYSFSDFLLSLRSSWLCSYSSLNGERLTCSQLS
jgi:hypothetical protein